MTQKCMKASPTMQFSNDPSDGMIMQNEWRRDRMQQAVDEIESYAHGSWDCNSQTFAFTSYVLTLLLKRHEAEKSCFIKTCFAWCLEHQAISTEADGEEVVTNRIVGREGNGNIQHRVEQETLRKCRHRRQNPDDDDRCDVVVSDYLEEEWEQEEFDTRFCERMAKRFSFEQD
ncbi:hypothetical protein HRR80_000634 [Exophiala dermatitidis]|uniref:Uncharacterized protein n=1 Tax=Exophiala dermatitidis TaxID=5970 RepID=A0AAN6F3W0_EXODE|nr:hypothetical protein HRR80_000634 [Exophiala dermatitidis]